MAGSAVSLARAWRRTEAIWLALVSLWSQYLRITNYSLFYAGLSQLMVAMIFFQFTAIAILLGAEFNRGLIEFRKLSASGTLEATG